MFKLPDLPYDYDALQPVLSAETMEFHHDKHHAKYVETLNKLLEEAGETPSDLESVVRGAAGKADKSKIFNNGAQAWNHTFFWTCMSAEEKQPNAALQSAIGGAFGDLAKLKDEFVKQGVGHFGSGWVWLAADGATLKVLSTHDADDTLTHQGLTPLITCDLWEHAYYLDHQNDREGFLKAWFDALPDWDFAARQLEAAQGRGQAWRHPLPG